MTEIVVRSLNSSCEIFFEGFNFTRKFQRHFAFHLCQTLMYGIKMLRVVGRERTHHFH